MKAKKIYFFWICRDKEAFEWFQGLLRTLESDSKFDKFLHIQIYLTGKLNRHEHLNIVLNDTKGVDALTKLKTRTNYGRPKWTKIFGDLKRNHTGKVGVYFCGPEVMDKALTKVCEEFSGDRVVFEYHKDNFY